MSLIWGIVISVLGLVGAILISVVTRLISEDVKEWLPWITHRLIERSVSRLPEAEHKRFEEKWWSHVNELPGNLAKIYIAWSYMSVSKAINRDNISHVSALHREEASMASLKIVLNGITIQHVGELLFSGIKPDQCLEDFVFSYLCTSSVL